MSLITRCSACGTMFKVVADQLKVSQGWVRCGHCAEVFDATAHLQPFAPQGSAGPTHTASNPQPPSQDLASDAESLAPLLVTSSASPEAPVPERPDHPGSAISDVEPELDAVVTGAHPAAPEVQVSPSPDQAADVFAYSVSPEPELSSPVLPTASADSVSAFGESEAPEPDSTQDVSFVRDARRDALWRRPAMRGMLGLAALLLLAVLLLQVALFQRNTLVAWQPRLSPSLHTLCAYFRCEIGSPQHIESVVIDSSSFSKLATDAYRLKVVIKNTGTLALAMPSVELTLTDTQEQALLRRVLAPADLGATTPTLAAGAEFSGTVAIRVSPPVSGSASPASAPRPSGPLRIAGYHVLAFYP